MFLKAKLVMWGSTHLFVFSPSTAVLWPGRSHSFLESVGPYGPAALPRQAGWAARLADWPRTRGAKADAWAHKCIACTHLPRVTAVPVEPGWAGWLGWLG